MTFKSQAQREKFQKLHKDGKISAETLKRWEDETGEKELPKRITPKKYDPITLEWIKKNKPWML